MTGFFYFPLQEVTNCFECFISKDLQNSNEFKVQIRYNALQEIHF